MSDIQLDPVYKHTDDKWPMLINVTYADSDAVRFYVPDGGTDIPNIRQSEKEDLMRRMHGMLLVYERVLTEEYGRVISQPDWTALMVKVGCGVDE